MSKTTYEDCVEFMQDEIGVSEAFLAKSLGVSKTVTYRYKQRNHIPKERKKEIDAVLREWIENARTLRAMFREIEPQN